ncbi:MAG: AAA family ATPase [Verrucomicrobia bacterium]|nr:AAA family ATPase [Verrucomicrobiota bacterium]
MDSQKKIIGRVREKELLKDLFDSRKAEFIAVYGRRRVGKTYLIKNFIDSLPSTFFHVTGLQKGSLKEQLTEFAKQIGATFYQGASLVARSGWIDAFEDLTQAINNTPKDKKIVLFFDEFPWMATPRSKLITALELYWNRYWVFDDRIKLIICGSSTSWIIENIINNKGGLHNRVTRTIHLKPFSLYETENFLKEYKIHLTKRQILDLYIVLGGVPLYWSYIRKGRSAQQSIDELCFQSDGPLVKEFQRLFESLFEDAKPYMDLIRIIAKYRYGIGQAELISKANLPDGGTTVRRLHQLEEAGFITSLVPYGKKGKGIYYVIDDEYSLFYLYWIEPNLKLIAKKTMNEGFWSAQANQPAWKIWAALSFESICYKHIDQIRKTLKIDPGAVAATWRFNPKSDEATEGAQIDLLFDRLDGAISLCEIKCSDKQFAIDKSYAQELVRKMEVFQKQTKTKKQLLLCMITTMGLKPTMYSEEIVTNQATLEDLFKNPSGA